MEIRFLPTPSTKENSIYILFPRFLSLLNFLSLLRFAFRSALTFQWPRAVLPLFNLNATNETKKTANTNNCRMSFNGFFLLSLEMCVRQHICRIFLSNELKMIERRATQIFCGTEEMSTKAATRTIAFPAVHAERQKNERRADRTVKRNSRCSLRTRFSTCGSFYSLAK